MLIGISLTYFMLKMIQGKASIVENTRRKRNIKSCWLEFPSKARCSRWIRGCFSSINYVSP